MEELTELDAYALLFGGVGGMLFLVSTTVLVLVFAQRKMILKNQHILKLENQHQKELLIASLQSEEQERARIARDLHDEVGAMLSTTKLYLAQAQSKQTLADMQELASQANDLLTQTVQNMRAISQDLSPAVLTNWGLTQALQELASQVREARAVEVLCEWEENFPRFDKMQELMLYRIAQELLNNTLKHAQATQIRFALHLLQGKQAHFVYADNGRGFEMEKMKTKKGSLGLKNIESRSNTLGGVATFTSKANEGTRFEVRFGYKG